MWKILIAIPLLVLLSGCETFYANAVTDYQDTRGAIRSYVGENIQYRQSFRQKCYETVMRKVDQLNAEGKYGDALEMLSKYYPSLITIDMINNGVDSLNDSKICGAAT